VDGYFSLHWFEKRKEESIKVETVGNLYAVELEDAHLPVVFFAEIANKRREVYKRYVKQ
jgi:hypothetical protein